MVDLMQIVVIILVIAIIILSSIIIINYIESDNEITSARTTKAIEEIRKEVRGELLKDIGRIRKWWLQKVQSIFRWGIPNEVEDDIRKVQEAVYASLVSATSPEDVKTVGTILAYLDVARLETNIARSWRYLNGADALLPLIVPEDKLDSCTRRLEFYDKDIDEKKKDRIEEAKTQYEITIKSFSSDLIINERIKDADIHFEKAISTMNIKDDKKGLINKRRTEYVTYLKSIDNKIIDKEELQNRKNSFQNEIDSIVHDEKEKDKIDEAVSNFVDKIPPYDRIKVKRNALHDLQVIRTLIWDDFNNKIELKQDLWRSLGWRLFVATVTAIVAAIFAQSLWMGEPLENQWRFAVAPIFGFFGGAISAFISSRKVVIESPSYRSIRLHTVLRMLLGAVGAFVFYIIGTSFPLGMITTMLEAGPLEFMTICIVAGFSERLFIKTLEEVSENLKVVS